MKPAKLLIHVLCCTFVLFSVSISCFGANGVGYVNLTLVPGFNLVSNPLANQTGNSLEYLFTTATSNLPDGLSVHMIGEDGAFRTARYESLSGRFLPEELAAEELSLGEGFFVYNPLSTNFTVTFVGDVAGGTQIIPSGFSLQGSIVPRAATLSQLDFPAAPGDRVYTWNTLTQQFEVSIFDDLDWTWLPSDPVIGVAEGFVVFKQNPAEWVQPNPIPGGLESAFFLLAEAVVP